MPSYRYDVFISYNHNDSEWVITWLLPEFEKKDLKVYVYERDSGVGGTTLLNLEKALLRSRHVVLVFTPSWVKSNWTAFEAVMTQDADPTNLRGKILPILLQDCKIPARLKIFTFADFRNPADHPKQFDRIMQSILKAK